MAETTSGDAPSSKVEIYIDRKEYVDFTIHCEDVAFRVHKIFLIRKCRFFEKALTGEFKEANENQMSLDEEAPILRLFLAMLYRELNGDDTYDFGMLVKLYAMADKFLMPSLKSTIAQEFRSEMRKDFDRDGQRNLLGLSYVIHRYNALEQLLQTVDIVYSSTPDEDRGLRDHVVFQVANEFEFIEVYHEESFTEVLDGHGKFSLDLMRHQQLERDRDEHPTAAIFCDGLTRVYKGSVLSASKTEVARGQIPGALQEGINQPPKRDHRKYQAAQ